MKKAFTLIELLVVIAIIAILAAILFPVFAQAKLAAKKTQQLSNYKQTGTSAQIYLADYDDSFPQAIVQRPASGGSTWGYGLLVPVPYNGVTTAPWTQADRQNMASCYWANSLQPYMKNYQLFQSPVGSNVTVSGDTYLANAPIVQMGEMMNGYLNSLNSSVIQNVSVVPVFHNIQNINIQDRGLATPVLVCSVAGSPSCVWNGTGSPDGGAGSGNNGYYVFDGTHSVWEFGQKGTYSRADSSAKVQPTGTTVSPGFVNFGPGMLIDAWANVGTTGTPGGLWPCDHTFAGQGDGNENAWCFFRPDRVN